MEQHEEDHLILDGRKVSTQETKTHRDEKESKAKNKLRMHKKRYKCEEVMTETGNSMNVPNLLLRHATNDYYQN